MTIRGNCAEGAVSPICVRGVVLRQTSFRPLRSPTPGLSTSISRDQVIFLHLTEDLLDLAVQLRDVLISNLREQVFSDLCQSDPERSCLSQ